MDRDRSAFVIVHAAGGAIGAAAAIAAFSLSEASHPWPEALALLWLASPLFLAGLALRAARLPSLELASTANTVLVLIALAAISGGLSSVFLHWLILVPAESALTRRPKHLALGIVMSCLGVGLLWLLARSNVIAPLALPEPWAANLSAVALMGAVAYAGLLAARVQSVHRKAADETAAREASYRFLTESVADPILRLSVSGDVLYASPSSEALFGAGLKRAALADLVDEGEREAVQRALARAAYFGEDIVVTCRAGERFIELRARAVTRPEDDKKPLRSWRTRRHKPPPREIIAIARDVTAERLREDSLERFANTASARSRAKSRFLANMSHELRTPLNSILGFSEMIGAEMFGPLGSARYREYAALIQESGRYLLELINDVLDLSKIEAGKYVLARENLDVGVALKRCLRVMLPQFKEKNVALDVGIAAGLPLVSADARAIRQILFNLLSNALKFTPAGGRAAVLLKQEAGSLLLEVKDTGVGISGADLKRLARPFEQAEDGYVKTQQGTGLGLALVRSLTGLHGGKLTIRSRRGQGTIVSVSLPLGEAAPVAHAA